MLAGGVVGLLVGLTGVGAGALMTPFLILVLGLPPTVAIATDLVFAVTTKLTAAVMHTRKSSVDWKVALQMWKGSIPGMASGVVALILLAASDVSSYATILLAFVLILTSAAIMRGVQPRRRLKSRHSFLFASGGLGFLVATTSVGAGALGMVLLRTKLGDNNPNKLVGTDLVHAVPIAAFAGLTFSAAGLVEAELLASLLVTSIPAAIAGSVLSSKIDAALLRRLIGAVLLIAAAGLILRGLS